jgi:thioredoxin-like negative regulator of GroEL
MSEHFKVEKVPTMLIIHQGSVLDVHEGSMDNASLTKLLASLPKQNSSSEFTSDVAQPKAMEQNLRYAVHKC